MKPIRLDFNHMISDYVETAYPLVLAELRKQEAACQDAKIRKTLQASIRKMDVPVSTIRERFIALSEIEAEQAKLNAAFENVEKKRDKNEFMMGWTRLPYQDAAMVKKVTDLAADIRGKCKAFVVLGIGGSALGPIMAQYALNPMRWNELSDEQRGGCPKFYVEDNIDPERMRDLLSVVDIENTIFNVVSKSGETSETMAQYLVIAKALEEKLGAAYRSRLVFTTDEKKGNLIQIAGNDIPCLTIPDGVGGRFSELSPVGLLPAAVCGIDVQGLLDGAREMDALCRSGDWRKNPALAMAILQYIAMEKKPEKKRISVIMPYAESLKYMADWYSQLFGESLGQIDAHGNNVGGTPAKVLGVTDQHSQVQLYTDGPCDKIILFIGVDKYRVEMPIPQKNSDMPEIPDVTFLSGHSLGEQMQLEQRATEYAVMKSGKLSFTITLPEVNANYLGQLMYLFEMQIAYLGEMLEIDAFVQPGVQEGKDAMYAMYDKPGFGWKKAELDARPPHEERFIIG